MNPKNILRNPISHDLEATILIAKSFAEKHQINYNIILMNPNPHGDFDIAHGSTYEFVADSYFEKPRPNVIVLHKTDDLLKNKNQ